MTNLMTDVFSQLPKGLVIKNQFFLIENGDLLNLIPIYHYLGFSSFNETKYWVYWIETSI